VPFGKQQLDAATGRVREDAIVRAANFALENTGLTLKYMITPHALRPLVWAAVRAAPPAAIDALNVARMQLFSAAVCLARNAMARLGRPWADELRMADKFGARAAARWCACVRACGGGLLAASAGRCRPAPHVCASRHTAR
jgi:hypothetical protein